MGLSDVMLVLLMTGAGGRGLGGSTAVELMRGV